MATSVQELRERIDAKHRRALEALSELEGYLAERESAHADNGAVSTRRRKYQRKPGSTIRDKVLAVISKWATVDQVCEETGLTVKQVRGVLHAPGLKGRVE